MIPGGLPRSCVIGWGKLKPTQASSRSQFLKHNGAVLHRTYVPWTVESGKLIYSAITWFMNHLNNRFYKLWFFLLSTNITRDKLWILYLCYWREMCDYDTLMVDIHKLCVWYTGLPCLWMFLQCKNFFIQGQVLSPSHLSCEFLNVWNRWPVGNLKHCGSKMWLKSDVRFSSKEDSYV